MPGSIIVLPSARRLVNSLRDIGYDLPTAVADVIDNSIAADSSVVDIEFHFDGDESWVRIADDGAGMGPSTLDEAMRYGTQREYGRSDLGRYGLGLKTASLSQCRRLTVASRRSPERRRIAIRAWDLDLVARTNTWSLLRLQSDEARPELIEPLQGRTGTVVLWERLDRVGAYRHPDGRAAERSFSAAISEVREHVSMVFHRFLAGEVRGHRRLRVRVNGALLEPWDPFCRSEPHTIVMPRQLLTLSGASGKVSVPVSPFVLPSQNLFSSTQAHARAAGPRRWNRQQGFYFYRNGRLLQAGGWNRLRTADEHTKLARVAVDIPPTADELFGVNVAKMRILVPAELRAALTAIASGTATRAGGSYRLRLTSGERQARRSDRGDFVVEFDRIEQVLMEELGDRDLVARVLQRLRSPTPFGELEGDATPFVIRRRVPVAVAEQA